MPSRLGRGGSASFAPNEAGSVLLSAHLAAALRRGIGRPRPRNGPPADGGARPGPSGGSGARVCSPGLAARQCCPAGPLGDAGFLPVLGVDRPAQRSGPVPPAQLPQRGAGLAEVAAGGAEVADRHPSPGEGLPGPAQARRMTVTSTDQTVTCPPGRRFRSASSTTPSAADSKSIHTSSVPGSAARSSTPEARGRTAVARHDPAPAGTRGRVGNADTPIEAGGATTGSGDHRGDA